MPELMVHQWISSWVVEKIPASLLFFDPGTGKTATVIDVLKTAHKRNEKFLVIVPAFLLHNWEAEIKMWWPEATVSVHGKKGKPADNAADVVLVSYDKAKHLEGIIRLRRRIICDEAHYLCGNSQRTDFVMDIVQQAKVLQLILMTGTPMNNRIGELYNLLRLMDIIDPKGFRKAYKGKTGFQMAFCYCKEKRIPGKSFAIREYYGLRNANTLRLWTGLWFIRFRLDEVIELPDIVMENVHVEGVNEKLNELLAQAWEASPNGIIKSEFEGNAVGEHISSAKACASLAKVKSAVEFSANVCRPAIIFTDHVQTAKDVAKALGTHGVTTCCVTGETPMHQRSNFVDRFQRGEIDYFVGTIGSCGVGINLTRAHTIVFVDYSWIPARNEQAIARAYRFGQKNKVVVYTLVGGRIDTKIHTMLQDKMKVIKEMDGDRK
jgi:SNF2 family DNA or RNA helicase